MRVTVSFLAEADIEAIADYIAQDNPTRAATFARELWSACLSLADAPYRFARLENYEARGYRRRPYESYAIIYRIDDEGILIVRVLSSSMDIDAALGLN